MSNKNLLNEEELLSSLDNTLEGLIDYADNQDRVKKQKFLEEHQAKLRSAAIQEQQNIKVRNQLSLVKEEYLTGDEVETVQQKPITPVDVMADTLSRYVARINKNKVQEDVVRTPEDQRFDIIEQRLEKMSRSIIENTIVSGIGQGGDGQTPGSGEVLLNRLDDVDMNGLENGQSLVWDRYEGKWKPGSSGGDVIVSPNPPSGNINTGDLWFNEGDLTLNIWNGDEWVVVNGSSNTREVALVNALPVAKDVYRDIFGENLDLKKYQTQEDYNILVAEMIRELDIIKPTMTMGDEEPEYAMEGDMWLDTTSYFMFIWNGEFWVHINGGSSAGIGEIDGGNASQLKLIDDAGNEVTITPSLVQQMMQRIRILEEKLNIDESIVITES